MSSAPVPGPFRAGPPVSGAPVRNPYRRVLEQPPEPGVPSDTGHGTGHPAVDAAVQAMANGADLPPGDQIAQYEAAHRTLQEILATIDQA